jgi:hypothetical protein
MRSRVDAWGRCQCYPALESGNFQAAGNFLSILEPEPLLFLFHDIAYLDPVVAGTHLHRAYFSLQIA